MKFWSLKKFWWVLTPDVQFLLIPVLQFCCEAWLQTDGKRCQLDFYVTTFLWCSFWVPLARPCVWCWCAYRSGGGKDQLHGTRVAAVLLWKPGMLSQAWVPSIPWVWPDLRGGCIRRGGVSWRDGAWAWMMAIRRPEQHRAKVDGAKCRTVIHPPTWPDPRPLENHCFSCLCF